MPRIIESQTQANTLAVHQRDLKRPAVSVASHSGVVAHKDSTKV